MLDRCIRLHIRSRSFPTFAVQVDVGWMGNPVVLVNMRLSFRLLRSSILHTVQWERREGTEPIEGKGTRTTIEKVDSKRTSTRRAHSCS